MLENNKQQVTYDTKQVKNTVAVSSYGENGRTSFLYFCVIFCCNLEWR